MAHVIAIPTYLGTQSIAAGAGGALLPPVMNLLILAKRYYTTSVDEVTTMTCDGQSTSPDSGPKLTKTCYHMLQRPKPTPYNAISIPGTALSAITLSQPHHKPEVS